MGLLTFITSISIISFQALTMCLLFSYWPFKDVNLEKPTARERTEWIFVDNNVHNEYCEDQVSEWEAT